MSGDNTNDKVKKPKVVIIGDGFGGLSTAQKPDDIPVEVILVDRKNHFIFQEVDYAAENILRDLRGEERQGFSLCELRHNGDDW